MHQYSLADLKRLFKLPASLIHSLARNHHITDSLPEGTTSYTSRDLLMLRAAGAMKAAKIAAPQIIGALRNFRNALPPDSASRGNPIALAAPSARRRAHAARFAEAEAHYARGHALEESDVNAARAAYLDALNAHSDHVEARINLGRLLHLTGELKQAEKVYRQAKSSSALLSFNLAILLEDLNREEDAINSYREALAQDPQLHDAHFNLSRLHERANQPREALRHLLAYRRHVRQVQS